MGPQVREKVDCYKATVIGVIGKNYQLSRYICPRCSARYGEPDRQGNIDIERCEPCSKIKVIPKKKAPSKLAKADQLTALTQKSTPCL